MNSSIVLLLILAFGTLLLRRTGYEHHMGFLFLIRTRHGLKLMDWLASLCPGFWKFLADTAIIFSFSGLGAAYLYRSESSRRNLYIVTTLVGIASIILVALVVNPWYALMPAGLLVLLAFRRSLQTVFLANTVFFTIVFFTVFTVFTGSRIPVNLRLFMALMEGVLGLPVILFAGLMFGAYQIVFNASNLPGVSPMLPGTRGGEIGMVFPGYDIFIPWWYALIALAATLLSHEMAHGIMSRVHGIRLKSTGLLTAGIVPIGAFVEPDEEELKKRPRIEAMHVYGAGSFANLIVSVIAAVAILAILFATPSIVTSHGLRLVDVAPGSPASQVLEGGLVIYGINGQGLNSIVDFTRLVKDLKPGDSVVYNTSKGLYEFNTTSDPANSSKSYMGVYVTLNPVSRIGFTGIIPLIGFIVMALEWIVFFNFNIGLVNLLPVLPFDGGRMFPNIISTLDISKDTVKRITYLVILVTGAVFAINVFPLFRMLFTWMLGLTGF